MSETYGASGPAAAPATRDADEAWRSFLAEQASLILQVVHIFERDADEVQDCFLFVCERLRRDGMRRIGRFREAGPASFATWLRAVVRRLCLDWRRHRDGRFRLPRAIARLPELDQEVFRCIHVRRLSENETLHSARALWPGLTREQLAESRARVGKSLDGRQSWLLLVRRPRLQSLSDGPEGSDPAEREPGLVDPVADPEREASERERLGLLGEALDRLPPRSRLLVRLRFGQELPLEEVARLTGLSGAAQAERHIQEALEELRARLGAKGPAGVSGKEK